MKQIGDETGLCRILLLLLLWCKLCRTERHTGLALLTEQMPSSLPRGVPACIHPYTATEELVGVCKMEN